MDPAFTTYCEYNTATTDERPVTKDWNEQRQIAEQMSGEVTEFVREYTEKKAVITWCRRSGLDVLEESVYPADSIGIVPIYGNLLSHVLPVLVWDILQLL